VRCHGLKVAIVVTLPAKIEEEGGVTVGARQAFEIAKGLSGEEVHLRRTENNLDGDSKREGGIQGGGG